MQAQAGYDNSSVISDFVNYVNEKIAMLGITNPDCVCNFDKTNVYFAPEFTHTIAEKGAKTVSIVAPASANQCTVMLGCSFSGKKLPPYVVWKGTDTGQIAAECCKPVENGLAPGITYAVQCKAWMDEARVLDWIERVWKPHTMQLTGHYLLVWDSFMAHVTAAVKMKLAL